MAGTFTSEERVVRDGVLVAFKGQQMTEEEAKALGLVKPKGEGEKPAKRGKKEATAEAEALGIAVPSKATIAQIDELIAEKRAELEAKASEKRHGDAANASGTSESDDTDTNAGDDQTGAENASDGAAQEDGEDD